MSTLIWVAVVVIALVALGAVAYIVMQQQRRTRLRSRFGPEYDRLMAESDNRHEAERELISREQRHEQLDIRPLADDARDNYARRWAEVQEHFVDAPGPAVTEADRLLSDVMTERGYPTDGYEQRMSDLSVGHASTLDHYRKAHEISGEDASTEDLRQAMVHYRALFEDLLEAPQKGR